MQLKDGEARKKIADQLDINILVEAGAGSGKTASLVKRMLNLIMQGRCRVEELAAITFTRKAAAELRERFQDKLEKSLAAASNPQTRQVLSEALMNLDRCFVGTIHAFCARLLRERPVEAGIDPGFEEVDDVRNFLLMERAWQEYLLEVKTKQPLLLEQVEQLGVSPEELKSLFHKLSAYPEVEISAQTSSVPGFQGALRHLSALLQEASGGIPDPPHENRFDALQERILRARRMFNNLDLTQHTNAVRVLSLFEKTPAPVLKLWQDKDDAKSMKGRFEQFSNSQAAPLLQAWREYCHFHISAFLLPGRAFLSNFKDRHAVLGFHDLLLKAATMLRESPEARSYFKRKYRCLLVDEFQDTDPLQSEMMFCLTGSDICQKNWQELSPEPGSLFVVGDPKQSIYRFRRADIDTYNQVKNLIKKSGGEILLLTTNFRCLKPLEEFSNDVFEKLFAHTENSYQALFSPIAVWRTDMGDTTAGVRIMQVAATFTKKEEIVLQDALQVAAFVRHALDGAVRLARSPEEKRAGMSETPRPADFLIILAYKDMMEEYARALEEQGIPVTMTGGSSIGESLELGELLKLLRYLNDPQNQVLLMAVLRGLFFGISDAALYRFKAGGGSFNPLAAVPEAMDGAGRQIFIHAFERLGSYLQWKKAYPPTVALEKIIEALGLVPFSLSRPLGERNCSYLYQVLEYMRRGKTACAEQFQQMVEQLESLLDAGVEEELDLNVSAGDSVRLMNLHKAKGLEAPVVVLANPFKRVDLSSERIDSHIVRTGDQPVGYFSFSRESGFQNVKIAQPIGWDAHAAEEQKYLEAEKIRLLYVAATRARNLLVISTSAKDPAMTRNPWRELLENYALAQTESLSVPGPTDPRVALKEAPVNLQELAGLQQKLHAWAAAASSRGWSRATPSEIRVKKSWEDDSQIPDHGWEDAGDAGGRDADREVAAGFEVTTAGGTVRGGAQWGRLMHRTLEALVKGEADLEGIIAAEAEALQLHAGCLQEALQEVERFKETALWQEILLAGANKHTELPFNFCINQEHNHPVVVNGTIDLAYRGPGGWVIVDYKTDQVNDDETLRRLLHQYTPQLHTYIHAFNELTGETVTRGEIYFLTMKRSVQIF